MNSSQCGFPCLLHPLQVGMRTVILSSVVLCPWRFTQDLACGKQPQVFAVLSVFKHKGLGKFCLKKWYRLCYDLHKVTCLEKCSLKKISNCLKPQWDNISHLLWWLLERKEGGRDGGREEKYSHDFLHQFIWFSNFKIYLRICIFERDYNDLWDIS